MKNTTTYLMFNGNAKETMSFYAKCLDAELQVMPFGEENSKGAPENKDRTMHANLSKGPLQGFLMASDSMPGQDVQIGDNFNVCINCESMDEIKTLFAAFSDGGTVLCPLQDMFWGAHFGIVKDRFSVAWMFNYELPKAS